MRHNIVEVAVEPRALPASGSAANFDDVTMKFITNEMVHEHKLGCLSVRVKPEVKHWDIGSHGIWIFCRVMVGWAIEK